MVGRILLLLVCVFLVLLSAAVLLPVSLRIQYEQGTHRVTVRYARWVIYPRKKTKTASTSKKAKKTPPSPQKERAKINSAQIRYSLDQLPPVLLRALRRTGRKLRITPLKVHVLVATGDPADTAILYGKLEAILASVLPVLHGLITIEEQDIRLFPDFCEETMDYIVDAGVTIRLLDLVRIALCALGGIIQWWIGFQKRATKSPKTSHKTTAQAETAA